MKILLTAFDPFGGERVNAAAEALALLADEIAGARIVRVEVPTVFGASVESARAAIDAYRPDAVVCLGQAAGRGAVTPERVALNVDDARIPDNAGNRPLGEPIAPDGPAAYFATLPVRAMVREIRSVGLPADLSNTAGTFVCNHLMYGVLHHLATTGRAGVRAGFIHVPLVPAQAAATPGAPSMAPADIARGLTAAISAVVGCDEDIRTIEGATH